MVGVNIKREMVLLPKLQTKTAKKTIPYAATQTYIAYIRDPPPQGEKPIADYESYCYYTSETNNLHTG